MRNSHKPTNDPTRDQMGHSYKPNLGICLNVALIIFTLLLLSGVIPFQTPYPSTEKQTQQPNSQPMSHDGPELCYGPEERHSRGVPFKENFPGEYETIKKAAQRNNCTGRNFAILLAIRVAENGPEGTEFGIMAPEARNTDLDTQAGWAAATIVKNRRRWKRAGKPGTFIGFLGNRYAPPEADNDPQNLNRHWVKNVKYWTTVFILKGHWVWD